MILAHYLKRLVTQWGSLGTNANPVDANTARKAVSDVDLAVAQLKAASVLFTAMADQNYAGHADYKMACELGLAVLLSGKKTNQFCDHAPDFSGWVIYGGVAAATSFSVNLSRREPSFSVALEFSGHVEEVVNVFSGKARLGNAFIVPAWTGSYAAGDCSTIELARKERALRWNGESGEVLRHQVSSLKQQLSLA